MSQIIKRSENPSLPRDERVFLQKLDMVLVQILKQDWPQNWPNFIPDLVGASERGESLCENNMFILKLLR